MKQQLCLARFCRHFVQGIGAGNRGTWTCTCKRPKEGADTFGSALRSEIHLFAGEGKTCHLSSYGDEFRLNRLQYGEAYSHEMERDSNGYYVNPGKMSEPETPWDVEEYDHQAIEMDGFSIIEYDEQDDLINLPTTDLVDMVITGLISELEMWTIWNAYMERRATEDIMISSLFETFKGRLVKRFPSSAFRAMSDPIKRHYLVSEGLVPDIEYHDDGYVRRTISDKRIVQDALSAGYDYNELSEIRKFGSLNREAVDVCSDFEDRFPMSQEDIEAAKAAANKTRARAAQKEESIMAKKLELGSVTLTEDMILEVITKEAFANMPQQTLEAAQEEAKLIVASQAMAPEAVAADHTRLLSATAVKNGDLLDITLAFEEPLMPVSMLKQAGIMQNCSSQFASKVYEITVKHRTAPRPEAMTREALLARQLGLQVKDEESTPEMVPTITRNLNGTYFAVVAITEAGIELTHRHDIPMFIGEGQDRKFNKLAYLPTYRFHDAHSGRPLYNEDGSVARGGLGILYSERWAYYKKDDPKYSDIVLARARYAQLVFELVFTALHAANPNVNKIQDTAPAAGSVAVPNVASAHRFAL